MSPKMELTVGAVALILWGLLQFGLAPHTGWIHLCLILGVGLVIRGIARSDSSHVRMIHPDPGSHRAVDRRGK